MTIATDEEGVQNTEGNPSARQGWSRASEDELLAIRRVDSAQKQDLLFEAFKEEDGYVDSSRITSGVEGLRAKSLEVQLQYLGEAATAVLRTLDQEGSQRLGKTEFKLFVDRFTAAVGTPSGTVSEFLLMIAMEIGSSQWPGSNLLQERAEPSVQAQATVKLSEDPGIGQLFAHFNRCGSGRLDFSEVCHMLHKLRQDISLQEARAQAVSIMLLGDMDSRQALSLLDFTRFLQKLGFLLNMEVPALAESLLPLMQHDEDHGEPEDAATADSIASRDAIAQVYETLADQKLHLLFELWDKDGDGHISFAELALGLRKLSLPSDPVTEVAADAAEAMLLFDLDANQKLDKAEFTSLINRFCEACGTDFNTLSEFLILLAALEDNPSEELAFLLSESKVERAVSDLSSAWRQDRDQDPAQGTVEASCEAEAGASQASVGRSNSQDGSRAADGGEGKAENQEAAKRGQM